LLLPNRENAFIELPKLTDYLLSESHAVGKSKAKFFRELGFNQENVAILEKELLNYPYFHYVTECIITVHGINYVIVGTLNSPNGKIVNILTVWIIDVGQENPRFVTARPFSETKG
jgi:hypothetical protein